MTFKTKDKSLGRFIKHVACSSPSCNSSDAMAVYQDPEGNFNATCFSCGHYDPNPELDNTPKQDNPTGTLRTTLTVDQIGECPILPLPDRGISQNTVDFYQVRTILNGLDGKTPVAWCFPYYIYNIYNSTISTSLRSSSNFNTVSSHPINRTTNSLYDLSGFKKRLLEGKHFSSIGNTKDTMLFGQQKFLSGGKTLYITEGEIDCLTVYQVLKENSTIPDYQPCVVSLPHGASSAVKALANNQSFLDKFKEIRLVFDMDEAGRQAVEEVCAFLDPSKVKIVEYDLKDPNEMLMQNRARELLWACLTGAKSYVPSGITTSKELLTEALKPAEKGYSWPWPSLNLLTYGIRPGLYGIGAGVGIGKTEFFHELIYHLSIAQEQNTAVFLLEEAPQRTAKILAGKHLNLPLHNPDTQCDSESIEGALKAFHTPRELVYIFNHKGSRDWETIYTQCRYLASVHGVRNIIIDPLTAIISHEDNTDRALHKLMADMAVLTQPPYSCAVFFSSHLNEPPRDKTPHEEGGRVKEAHFAGSRAMIRFSNYIIALERNKQDPDVVQRNTTTCRILKDRDFGTATGETFEIYYDQDTGRYLEQNSEF